MQCGWCYKQGHAKTSCPQLSEVQKNHYKQIAKNRACKHCSRNYYDDSIGHNIRGCKRRPQDREEYINNVILYRKKLIEIFDTHSIGFGTIVSVEIPRWRRWGQLSELENDIIVLDKLSIPNRLEVAMFEARSTFTNQTRHYAIYPSGIENIKFPSVNPDRGEVSIYVGRDECEILSPRIENVPLCEEKDILDRENIRFPKNLE